MESQQFELVESATPILTLHDHPAYTHLAIGCWISINLDTGKVDIPDGLSPDDASRKFWKAVESIRKGIPT